MENLLLTYFMDDKTNIFQNRKSDEEFGTALRCFVNSAKVIPNRRHLPSYAFIQSMWYVYASLVGTYEENPG